MDRVVHSSKTLRLLHVELREGGVHRLRSALKLHADG